MFLSLNDTIGGFSDRPGVYPSFHESLLLLFPHLGGGIIRFGDVRLLHSLLLLGNKYMEFYQTFTEYI